jgi:hypothetical protein
MQTKITSEIWKQSEFSSSLRIGVFAFNSPDHMPCSALAQGNVVWAMDASDGRRRFSEARRL